MARIRINTRTHTKEKPYLINSYFFKIGKAKKVNRVSKIRVCMYVNEICAEEIFVTFPWWLKNVKSRSKIAFSFQMSAILKFDFQKREQLRFPEVNCLNYTHTHKCGNYIFHKTRGNKNKPWTHSTSRKALGPEICYLPLHTLLQVVTPHQGCLELEKEQLWRSKELILISKNKLKCYQEKLQRMRFSVDEEVLTCLFGGQSEARVGWRSSWVS